MNNLKKLTGNKNLLIFFLILVIISALFAFSYFIGCPIRLITGIPCPSCGITRAYISLLNGDLPKAFYYHPLFFLLPKALVLVILLLLNEKKRSGKFTRPLNIISISLLSIYMLTYLVRLFTKSIP